MPPKVLTRFTESLRHRRALHAAALQMVCENYYDDFGFSPAAAAKFREANRRAVKLALAAFAHDVHRTAQAIIDLCEHGEVSEAHSEKRALIGRVIGNWAWQKVGLPPPWPNLFELAAPLGLGLVLELKDWLLREGISLPELVSWLAQYGQPLKRFDERAMSIIGK